VQFKRNCLEDSSAGKALQAILIRKPGLPKKEKIFQAAGSSADQGQANPNQEMTQVTNL
jgi:hypothetical protein